MSKNDRNHVTLGPARVKVEDSIYEAVDQGIVGTTNVTTTSTDPGFVPIGPIGDLITPPVLDPVTGYPIYAADIDFSGGVSYPSLSAGTSWNILDTSAIGGFSNSLVVGAGGSDLAFVNLDNPAQRTIYYGKFRNYQNDFIIRDGVLTHGWESFINGQWVANDVDVTLNGQTQTVTGASINANMAVGKSDLTHRYFFLGFGWGVGTALARIAHTGPLVFEVVALTDFASLFTQSIRCVANDKLWIGGRTNSGFNEYAMVIDIATGAYSDLYNVSNGQASNLSNSQSWFGLTTGEAAYLSNNIVINNTTLLTYNLSIMSLSGSITVQSQIITLDNDSLIEFADVFNTNTMLAITNQFPRTMYQISPAGYQVISGTPDNTSVIRMSDAAPGQLRFFGDTYPTTGNPGLYQVVL